MFVDKQHQRRHHQKNAPLKKEDPLYVVFHNNPEEASSKGEEMETAVIYQTSWQRGREGREVI